MQALVRKAANIYIPVLPSSANLPMHRLVPTSQIYLVKLKKGRPSTRREDSHKALVAAAQELATVTRKTASPNGAIAGYAANAAAGRRV